MTEPPAVPPLEQQIKSREDSFAHYIKGVDEEIAREGYNDDNKIWEQVRLSTQNISSRYALDNRPNVLYEYDLRELWYLLLQGAKITSAEHPAQDRLASQVLHALEMGVLTRVIPASKLQYERTEIATNSDAAKVWSDLPFLYNTRSLVQINGYTYRPAT